MGNEFLFFSLCKIMLWSNSYDDDTVFRMGKKVIRLITKKPCSQHFRQLKIFPLSSLRICASLLFLRQSTQASPMAITLRIHISTETPQFESIPTIEKPVFK